MQNVVLSCRGHAQYGELAYGENGKKSSANPDKCQALEGVATQQVGLKSPCSSVLPAKDRHLIHPVAATVSVWGQRRGPRAPGPAGMYVSGGFVYGCKKACTA